MKFRSLLKDFLVWRIKNIKEKHFIFFLSILVGLFTGLIAVILKNSVFLIQDFLRSGFLEEHYDKLHFIYPLIGLGLVSWITIYILKRPSIKGITGLKGLTSVDPEVADCCGVLTTTGEGELNNLVIL